MCEFEPRPAVALPGGIGISKLTVYDVDAPDGLAGGTPHLHLACSEGYYVVADTGGVQTLNTKGYPETPLHAGTELGRHGMCGRLDVDDTQAREA